MITPPDPAASLETRSSLLFRLRNWQDAASWEEFYHLYRKLVFGFTRRSGLSHAEAEEVTQDVFKRVAETIHEFESNPDRGSFRGWLMNLTRWRISDKFRERQRAEHLRAPRSAAGEDDDRTSTIERVPDRSGAAVGALDPAWEEEWQTHLLDAALSRLARRAPARHFQVFELYARQGWPVTRVAKELGVTPATVYVINHRLKKQLKDEFEKLRNQLG